MSSRTTSESAALAAVPFPVVVYAKPIRRRASRAKLSRPVDHRGTISHLRLVTLADGKKCLTANCSARDLSSRLRVQAMVVVARPPMEGPSVKITPTVSIRWVASTSLLRIGRHREPRRAEEYGTKLNKIHPSPQREHPASGLILGVRR